MTALPNDYRTDAAPPGALYMSCDILGCLKHTYITICFSKYNRLLAGYMGSVGTDMTIDLSPPKALYIDVRVKQDYGELETPDGEVKHLQIRIILH